MGQKSGYQATISKLYALYKEKGFLREEEALSLMYADNISLVGINRITDRLIDMGVLFSDGIVNRFSINDSDEDEADYAQIDYESIYCEVLRIAPGLKVLINYIRGVRPPQYREWQSLIPQMRSGNSFAKERLYNMYLRVVVNIALRFHKDEGIEIEDAIQEGVLGLIRAIKQFDKSINGSLPGYIPLWIQQHISRAVADKERIIRIPVHAIDNIKLINKVKNTFENEYGREPSIVELSKETCISINNIETLMNCIRDVLSLDNLFEEDEDFDIVDLDMNVEDIITKRLLSIQINYLLTTLTDRESDVLKMRYGYSGGEECTLEEIGNYYGLTRERIRQIEAKAFRKLHHHNRLKWIIDYQ